MAVPVPALHSASTVLTTAETTTWYNTMQWLLAPPKCRLTTSATTTTGTAFAWSSVAFNTEAYDSTSMHDTVTNNSRITIATSGFYRLMAKSRATANVSLGIRLAVSGSAVPDVENWAPFMAGPGVADTSTSATLYLTAGQYVEAQVASSGAATVVASSTFEAHWVSN